MLARIRRLFRYEAWANREALASVATVPAARRVMGHVVAAQWLWLSRLRGQPSPVPVWPEWTAAECAGQADEVVRRWEDYLAELTEERLGAPIQYVNSKGEPWRSTVEDVLMHAVLHSAYHRGQAAREVREAGGEPAYTDFIHAVRQGLVS